MSTSVASSINLSSLGLGTGMNDSSIISQLVAIDSVPLTTLQTKAASITSASSTLATFTSDMKSLQTAANSLSDPTQYNVFSASSSQSSVVATTAAGATAGTHSVTVTTVAQAQTTYSDPQDTNTTALGLSGTLGLTVGGSTYNVSVSSTDSLADIAANITASGGPVTASVVYDGSQYRLDVQGTQTGAANAITFNESGFSLGLSTAKNTYQAAQDTQATVDGIPVTSSTSQITGAIPGVTLAVTGPTTGAATVNVLASSSALATNITSFITAYNTVVTAGHTDTGYATTPAANSVLQSDPAIRTCLDQLAQIVAGTVGGTDSSVNTLGSVGVNLNSDGTLTLDSTKLAAAIQSDPTGVEKLLVTSTSQGMTGVMGTISSTIDSLATNGNSVLTSESQYFTKQTSQITKQESALTIQIQAYQSLLQTEFTTADETVNTERTLFSAVGGSGTFM